MWFVLALGAALAQAAQFAVIKGRARDIPTLVILLWSQALGVLAWAIVVLASGGPWTVPAREWPPVAGAVGLALGMTFLLTRASARGDISVVGPVLALSPVFAIVPDGLISGSWPRGLGWLGLALSIVGTMSLSRGAAGVPALRFFARRDALDALAAAVVLGLLSAVDRRNAIAIGVPVYLLAQHVCIAVLLAVVTAARQPREVLASFAPREAAAVLAVAVLATAGLGLQITAMTLAPAAYVNAMRRTSAIFSVVLGRTLFGEEGVAERLLGAVLTTAGALCLLLSR